MHRYGNMLSGLWPRSKTGSLGTKPDVPARCILQTSRVHCRKLSHGTPAETSLIVHKALQHAHENDPEGSGAQVRKYALMTVAQVQNRVAGH